METNRAFYLGIVFLLLAVDCSLLNWKVNVIAKIDSEDPESKNKDGSNEQASVSNSVSDSNVADKGKKNKGSQVIESKENIDDSGKHDNNNNNSNSNNNNDNNNKNNDESGQSGSRKTDNVEKDTSDLKEKSQAVGDDKVKTMPKENSNHGDSGVGLKDSHVEECDPSNKCTDDENKLVACLRVPGNDRQYSLLIQNKGRKPLTVTISAPDFVQLEKTEIKLQAEGNLKVEVSITKGGNDNLIVLRAGKGHCDLDIKHLIAENSDNEFNSEKSTYMNFMSGTHAIVVLSLAALLILAVGWTCKSFWKKQLSASGSKYQRLEMDLPVSGGGKAESEHTEGWDNSWGGDWDDEEAPKTPSMPVTPNLSSKGLASRRLSKEGWKD